MRICLPVPTFERMDLWAYTMFAFPPSEKFVIGSHPDGVRQKALDGATYISSVADLPNDPLVLLTPSNARFVPGDTNLTSYSHPANAIYLFGPDDLHIHDDFLDGRIVDKVFIKTDAEAPHMFAATAYAITHYDIAVKSG